MIPINHKDIASFADKWWPDAICADMTEWTEKEILSLDYEPDKSDTWQLPAETKERGSGDCEDLCIAWLHYRLKTGAARAELALLVDGTPGKQHAVGTDGKLFYECRARKRRWRAHRVMRDDFTPWFRLQLDGQSFMMGI